MPIVRFENFEYAAVAVLWSRALVIFKILEIKKVQVLVRTAYICYRRMSGRCKII